MESKKELFGICPFVTSQKVLTGKWSLLIMYHLSEGPVRFNELQRRLPNLTQATLSKQLKALEADGLIHRKEYPQIPPKVEYSMSEIGRKFKIVLESLEDWGNEYIEYLEMREKEETGIEQSE
ncbi:winged helix-turn-helix transcriptional regulator [Aminipila sp.]|uniref:winged helix-turn-helix transcriptional regulator n=1 Tax=Aminipila sp. TaxID=2060095 RepID=UPI0028A0CB0D|nr:helix-turn-helix domain-containing protein [Aminipila sp.]